jgi:hypothetical protein
MILVVSNGLTKSLENQGVFVLLEEMTLKAESLDSSR